MFGRKEKQLQMERARQMSARVEACRSVMERVDADISDAAVELDQIHMSAVRMDGSLTKVVNYTREAKESQKKREEELLAISDKLTDFAQTAAQLQQAYDAACREVCLREDELKDLMEHSKHYTDLSKKLSEAVVRYQEFVDAISEKIADMEAFGNQIGALALQTAVEAGRLGAEGAQYIEAAQQIRDFSEGYQELADNFRRAAGKMSEAVSQNSEDVHQLIQQLKDNNLLLKKAAGKATAQREDMERLQGSRPEEPVQEAIKQMQHLRGDSRLILQKQEAVLGEMESVGACYLEEQESVEKVEAILERMRQTMAHTEPEHKDDEKGGK